MLRISIFSYKKHRGMNELHLSDAGFTYLPTESDRTTKPPPRYRGEGAESIWAIARGFSY